MIFYLPSTKRGFMSRLSLWTAIIAVFASIGLFTVSSAHAAQATVKWTTPSTYTDGTALTSVTGYKVYYGTSPGQYNNNVSVGNQTSYTVTNLADATTYYFAVMASDSSGNTSGYTKEVAYTTPAATTPSNPLYTIQASAGAGGTISPSGAVAISMGSNQTFSITPSTGYQIAGVNVDGVSVGAVPTYTFSNVAANHTIGATFAVASGSGTTAANFAVNSGGAQYTSSTGVVYGADAKFSGGNTATTTATIMGTSDGKLYQSERYGNFSYNIPVSNGSYSLALKFAETYWTAAGKRVFNVAVNGQTVISKLDIYAKVGKNTAYDVIVPVNVTNGAINVTFSSVVDNAKISAINVLPAAATTGTVAFANNAGGAGYLGAGGISYVADSRYSGGNTATTTATISGTNDAKLYQSERYGNFSYNIPVANGNYSVVLKFAETYWSASGKRVFNVAINGQTAISNLDIYAKVGKNAAYDVAIPVNVTNGTINVTFSTVVDNAKVSAILVKSN